MATSKKTAKARASKKKVAKKAPVRRAKSRARSRLTPAKKARGLSAEEILLGLDAPEIAPLVDAVRAVGGVVIGAYREPLSGRPLLHATVPIKSVVPTPFQRDLSPTHTKRLAAKIEESGSFLDPLIVVQGAQGQLWTPNGRHRLAAAKTLGLQHVAALISADEGLAFRILALNTEKAHNLKDRSLEVVRMARELAQRHARTKETDYAEHFEASELLTLGIVYEQNKRFAGGAYRPLLRKVDRFVDKTLRASLRVREGYASRLLDIDAEVKKIIEQLQQRGFKSPYLRTYVVARLNPVRWLRTKAGDAPPMTVAAALTRMRGAARTFDVATVNPRELALVAAMSD